MLRKYALSLLICFLGFQMMAQEITCTIGIDAQKTGKTQLSVFNTLERAVEDFLNNTRWSERTLPADQRIQANFFITINSYNGNRFDGNIQIQSSRPVYGSDMTTPIFNYKDNRFVFTYEENQPLEFNRNNFENNLVSTLAFYVYVILGLDADTFVPEGGTDFFAQADQIAGLAEQGGSSGWSSGSGTNSRYELNRQIYSSNFRDYHLALYQYHRLGLDMMHENVEEGKQNIVDALNLLSEMNRSRSNTLLVRSFFDAKANEVAAILSAGPEVEQNERGK